MWEKNVLHRLAIIGVVIVAALALLRNPAKTLRPGLDIAGGVSLIFEIDNTGRENDPNLAEEMKTLLQKRVDPQGVYDLTWRVHGQNRLEVQMPLPPPGVTELRRQYAEALEDLFATNPTRGDLEDAMARGGAERGPALRELARGSEERLRRLEQAAAAYDAYVAARQAALQGPQPATGPAAGTPETAPATSTAPAATARDLEIGVRDAEENLDDAYDAVLATNIDRDRFREILEIDETSNIRKNSLKEFIASHPELEEKIKNVVAAYAEWRRNRGYLDGPADLQRLLRGAGVLEFRILVQNTPENAARYARYRAQLEERGAKPVPGDELGWFRVDNPLAFFDLDTPAMLREFNPEQLRRYVAAKHGNDYYVLAKLSPEDGLLADKNKSWQLKNAMLDRDERGAWCVNFELDPHGGDLFENLTRKNIGEPLCILVDNVAYSAPNIKSKIRTRGVIQGEFSIEKASYLVQTMKAGSLPARLKETPVSERTIGSSLGQANRDRAFRAGIIGVGVVAVFMFVYYRVGGLIAVVAMLLNMLITLSIMALLQARINLAGIAGLVLSIAMSVDANVLIFERMREEKERGSSLRMIIKNGYDKAFSTILDSNLTTILAAAILYYLGSEEVKGFGLMLGWGIAISMFTALFVTRTIFTLLVKYGLLRDVRMLKLIGVPKYDWYGKRNIFVPASILLTVIGVGLLALRGREQILDVEFLGGVSAEVAVTPPAPGEPAINDVVISQRLNDVGRSIGADAERLAEAQVQPVLGTTSSFRVQVPGLDPERLAAFIAEPLEDRNMLQRGGVESPGGQEGVIVRLAGTTTAEQLQEFVRGLVAPSGRQGALIATANVGSVSEAGLEGAGRYWTVTTTAQNKRLVQHALEVALGDRLQRQQRIRFEFQGDPAGRPFPVLDRRLENVVRVPDFPAGLATGNLSDFRDGAALYFTDLNPPQSVDPRVPGSIADRLRNMRLQPGYQEMPYRRTRVIGVRPAGEDAAGRPLYSSAVVLVADENFRYSDDPDRWYAEFAQKEQQLASAAMESEQSLRKVSQFKPQIAAHASTQAILALVVSWLMIIAYLWVRFGRPMYGVAGIAALLHDVFIALAFVGIAHWLAPTFLGRALLIEDFKINATVIAAILTIIGYSVNDTIVIFDRIRETRGRLGHVTPTVINDAINQCLSRTILTGTSTLAVLAVMYIFGGSSTRAFNYCMFIGVITGTYSSFAIAAPLLMWGVKRERAAAPAGLPAVGAR